MCGIFVCFGAVEHFQQANLVNAMQYLTHRGPDNLGYFSDQMCFMGHTRLSIMDVHNHANQPFYYGDLVLVYNGEIFNYVELKEQLLKLDYKFETTSDTEVVIKSFHQWGHACFSKFNGMWSLAIYNKKEQSLLISRDRFAQKPLFISKTDKAIFFSSEIHPLVSVLKNKPNYQLIKAFLLEGTYESNGFTFFDGIEEFPKAHYLSIDSNQRRASQRYWSYPCNAKKVTEHDFKLFENLLIDAIKIRLRSDVPLSILLSGGVDSTVIAGYVAQLIDVSSLSAFTYASKDQFDESQYAKEVAKRLGFDTSLCVNSLDYQGYRDRLKQLVKHLGRGHSSPAVVSVDLLYETIAQNNVKVVLDGQGADELLAGYKHYHIIIIFMCLIRGKFKQFWLNLKDLKHEGFINIFLMWVRNVMPNGIKKLGRWLYGYETVFCKNIDKKITSEKIVNIEKTTKKNKNMLNRYLIQQHDIGLENLLYYGDIVAMKNSIENRSPFMDHRLVEFVMNHADELKVCNSSNKAALKKLDIYKEFSSVLDRKKIGFSSNINHSILKAMVDELRVSSILNWPIFDQKKINKMLNSDILLKPRYERFLFRLFQVHLWHEAFYR
ncbi:asparagine synthase (glutamine-hydrolyzing) [Thiotrichales bacterium 19S9-12]|nr:asparagine synthase (glutamine-hydrolyzing) [Thiotrichales bacterium 19S9-11]MCF6810954.1 asparagine synthase (glutamine-hydrolyzing) [Thiotrichales bacterium 19S9-12]